ncbi:unnamed protein product [Tilletia controversa]|uniref:DNA repair metallo-beta-lactamase domain-containing protein n=3 Tax=Tilletia TaxID=13289 RepID=A0A8X7N050_9BASI|nr:hypothetical protein CF336_g2891 [Tilletia laevis]KAE8204458.1 hypothetical protein CF328_g1067 [Tilletia controversa]KAE8262752.1 hypothetical protein A4X03_0g2206 [Tilletia caries]KAE8205904.1 hypothetical protein CF335_g2150 [Tilletia laevis]KAE8253997.1 hypothetical protein A4X06_0g1117 [Tilletia controversa]
MASPAKRRRTSPTKPQQGKASGSSGGQRSVLSFFGAAAASSSSSPSKNQAERQVSDGEGEDDDADVVVIDSKRPKASGPRTAWKPTAKLGPGSSYVMPAPASPQSPQKEADVQCPICGRSFPFRQVAAHAGSCLDFQPTEASTSSAAASTSATSMADAPDNSSANVSAAPLERAKKMSSERKFHPAHQNMETLETKPLSLRKASTSASNQAEGSAAVPSVAANVFAHLMNSHSALKQWASADAAESHNAAARGKSHSNNPRAAPFYKIVTGTPISVDAFRFGKIEGCTAYFLTHFHSDHYGGLTANWRWGYIYGSRTTCALVKSHLGVNTKWIRELPMETKTLIEDTGGVHVTLLDANHCPGSNLFLFEGPQTVDILRPGQSRYSGKKHFRALHCGDFRASPRHTNHPQVLGVENVADESELQAPLLDLAGPSGSGAFSVFDSRTNSSKAVQQQQVKTPNNSVSAPNGQQGQTNLKFQKIDTVYLDTTYLNPRYCFPAQEQVVQACADLVSREAARFRDYAEAMEQKQTGDGPVKQESYTGMMGSWLNSSLVQKEECQNDAQASDDFAAASSSKSRMVDAKEEQQRSPVFGSDVKQEEFEEDMHDGEEQLFLDDMDDALEESDLQGADADMAHEEGISPIKMEVPDPFDSAEAHSSTLGLDDAALDIKSDEREQTDALCSPSKEKKPFMSWFPPRPPNPNGRRKNRLLVLVGTYTIGKEKIVKACARALQTRIFCPMARKYDVYSKVEDPELHALLTRDPAEADVFVTNLSAINGQGLHDLVAELRTQGHDIKRAIAFRPTGWTYKPPAGMDTTAPDLRRLIAWNQSRNFGPDRLFPTRDSTREYQIYGVPYSEHSSFFELTAFALSLDYDRIIATVNVGNPTSRAKMEKWFERWALEKKRRRKAGEPDRLPSRTVDYW